MYIPLYVWYPEPKMTLPSMHVPHVYPSMLIVLGMDPFAPWITKFDDIEGNTGTGKVHPMGPACNFHEKKYLPSAVALRMVATQWSI